jgi:hypothetical protein
VFVPAVSIPQVHDPDVCAIHFKLTFDVRVENHLASIGRPVWTSAHACTEERELHRISAIAVRHPYTASRALSRKRKINPATSAQMPACPQCEAELDSGDPGGLLDCCLDPVQPLPGSHIECGRSYPGRLGNPEITLNS